MALERFANSPTLDFGVPWSTSPGAISAVTTTVNPASAAGFSQVTQFRVRVNSSAGRELILVVDGGGTTTWTVIRGIEGTTALAHPAGAVLSQVATAGALANHPRSMTTLGDMEYLNASLSPTRLAAPANGDYVARFTSGVPSWVAAPSVTPGGSTTQIQYNNAGAFGGSANLTWDGTSLNIGGSTAAPPSIASIGADTNIALKLAPKSSFVQIGPDTFGAAAWATTNVGFEIRRTASTKPATKEIVINTRLADVAFVQGAILNGVLQSAADGAQAGGYLAGIDISTVSNTAVGVATEYAYGMLLAVGQNAAGSIDNAYANYLSVYANAGSITNAYGAYASFYGAGAMTNGFAFYVENLASVTITNPYYFWADSRGVYRIREDNVADGSGNPQAIPSVYNPRFTKYVAGAPDFERSVEQWVANVLQIGAEAGGTGTLRGVKIIGASLDTPATLTANGVAVATASSATAFTNKTGNISQWTNDSAYLTSVSAHNLLSATHGDTTAGSVARGDLITGQGASPKWVRLAKGTANQVLAMDGTATDIAWTTLAGGSGDALVANPLSQFAATTSLQLKGVISDETGSGALVFADTPTLVTPVLGVATFTKLTGSGATVTASTPLLDLSQTWNSGGVTFDLLDFNVTNTASAAASRLARWRVGGTEVLSVGKAGNLLLPSGTSAIPSLGFSANPDVGIFYNGGGIGFSIDSSETFRISNGNIVYCFVDNFSLFNANASIKFGAAPDAGIARNGAGVLEVNSGSLGTFRDLKMRNIVGQTGYHEMVEMTAPSAGASNSVRIYAVDNGAGKTQLMALFATGASQQLAIEP